MLWLYISVALLLYAGPEKNKRGKESEADLTPQKIEGIVRNKCLKNADENAFLDVKNAIYNFFTCMTQNIHSPKHNDNMVMMICTEIHINGYKCLKNLTDKLKPCLAPEEKYLQHFLLSAHNSSFEQECEDDRRHYLEDKLSALQSVKCNPIFEHCIPKINLLKKLLEQDYIITKSDLCSDIEHAKECSIDEAKLRCINDTGMVEIITAMFNQFLSLCSDVAVDIND